MTDSPLLWRSASVARSAQCHTPQHQNRRNNATGTAGGGESGPDVRGDFGEGIGGTRRETAGTPIRDGRVLAWDMHPRESAKLLGLLFAWASKGAGVSSGDCALAGVEEGRVFTVVCPAVRIRMNLETYVKDLDTGRVAVQWSLASKENGECPSFRNLRTFACR